MRNGEGGRGPWTQEEEEEASMDAWEFRDKGVHMGRGGTRSRGTRGRGGLAPNI